MSTASEELVALPAPTLEITGVHPVRFAAAPTLAFDARISDSNGGEIYTVALTTQINIEPARRSYDDATREMLVELFGEPQRWGATTKSLMWTKVDNLVPSFGGETTFEIPVLCNYDSELAATKYFYSLPDGHVPLTFLFSGTIFYKGERGQLRLTQVPWSADARFEMPVEVWKDMMNHYYPSSGWVRLHTETLDALHAYKARHGLTSFDACVAGLLEPAAGRDAGTHA